MHINWRGKRGRSRSIPFNTTFTSNYLVRKRTWAYSKRLHFLLIIKYIIATFSEQKSSISLVSILLNYIMNILTSKQQIQQLVNKLKGNTQTFCDKRAKITQCNSTMTSTGIMHNCSRKTQGSSLSVVWCPSAFIFGTLKKFPMDPCAWHFIVILDFYINLV